MPDDFESRIHDFEQAWERNGPCEIDDFLEPPSAATSRSRLLFELICIDLEFRWRNRTRNSAAPDRLMLEAYAARFPELGSFDQLPIELITEEYRVRRLWGDRPTHAEFLSRLHEREEQIQARLLQIDRELEDESAAFRHIPLAAMRSCLPKAEADRALDSPLLSHHDVLLKRMIGAGQMGKVYQAWQHSANRAVAVKFLRKSFLDQPSVVQRFIDEARIIATMRHSNIVGIHGLGRTPGGSYFIVMELVAGADLAQLSRARPIAVHEAIQWAIETCDALEHAHSRGIIHCDLKPANLLLDGDGCVRVTDFGLARSLTELTPWTAEVEGTAPFMAPEQATRSWGPVGIRTDVYGLGAVLYTLLTGRPPWIGRRLPDVLADVISAAPVIAPTSIRPDLPKAISDLCRKCLSKAPEDRFDSVQDVRSALNKLIGRG
jgi:tRNA A-37 threonylcarbamoyl transferase component Bud32